MSLIVSLSGAVNQLSTPAEAGVIEQNEVQLQCVTAAAVVGIQLPAISTLPYNFKYKVNDISNNASAFNITITPAAGDTINSNAATKVISTDGECGVLSIAGPNRWAYTAGA